MSLRFVLKIRLPDRLHGIFGRDHRNSGGQGGVPEFLRRGFDGGMIELLCAGLPLKKTSALALKPEGARYWREYR